MVNDVEGALLEMEAVRRRYGGRLVLDIERLHVGAGEVLAVLGPNGAGKSTLFRILLLLERPDSGRIRLAGREVRVGDKHARGRVAGVFQRPYLFSGTVRRNLEFGLKATGIGRAEQTRRIASASEAMHLRGLEERNVRTLSGGEAQRVALARALLLAPDVLLLDEPLANLDVSSQHSLREDLGRLSREHARSVLLITHDPGDALLLADRIVVLQEGRITQIASPHELVMEPATPFVAAFTGAELLLNGRVEGNDPDGLSCVRLSSGATLRVGQARALARGTRVHVSYRPEEVVLSALATPFHASPRNVLRLRVVALTPANGLVRIVLEGAARLVAIVTRSSAQELQLRPGLEVNVHLKAAGLRAFAAADV
jgi:molybdopterin-binding protein